MPSKSATTDEELTEWVHAARGTPAEECVQRLVAEVRRSRAVIAEYERIGRDPEARYAYTYLRWFGPGRVPGTILWERMGVSGSGTHVSLGLVVRFSPAALQSEPPEF